MTMMSPSTGRPAGAPRSRQRSSNFDLYAWLFMRVSGVFLLFLVFAHVLVMHLLNDITAINYLFVAERWSTPFWRTFDWLMLILALAHGTVGLRTLIGDYVHRPALRVLSLVALASFALIFAVIGSIVILTFHPVTS